MASTRKTSMPYGMGELTHWTIVKNTFINVSSQTRQFRFESLQDYTWLYAIWWSQKCRLVSWWKDSHGAHQDSVRGLAIAHWLIFTPTFSYDAGIQTFDTGTYPLSNISHLVLSLTFLVHWANVYSNGERCKIFSFFCLFEGLIYRSYIVNGSSEKP